MIGGVLAVALIVGQGPNQGPSSCVAALDSMLAVLRRDYPGYADGVKGHEAAFTALIDSVRAVARTSDHHSVCIGQGLHRVIHFFRDGHLLVWQANPPPASSEVISGTPPTPAAVPADDPGRPALRFDDDSTAVLRLADFGARYKPLIDTLIAVHWPALTAVTYLIVDVRGNGGGYTGSYRRVSDLLYANPLHFEGVDVWASGANIEFIRGFLAIPAFSEADKALFRAVIPRMEAHPGQFVEMTPDTVVRRDSIYLVPRRVAVLIDRGCASTCEDFVLEARQSHKVTVLGAENTAGVHDYGNVRSLWLPGWRRMRVPTSRSRGERIDRVGLAPAVRISPDEPDAVAFARRYLRNRRIGPS